MASFGGFGVNQPTMFGATPATNTFNTGGFGQNTMMTQTHNPMKGNVE